MNFLNTIVENFASKNEQDAFCINDVFYTYRDLSNAVAKIAYQLIENTSLIQSKRIAVVCTNHINTYAGLIASWMCGFAYIPLGLHNPDERNLAILEDAEICVILSSRQLDKKIYTKYKIIDTSGVVVENIAIPVSKNIAENDLAYILFTSGSTGKPKGVPITFGNLIAFLDAFKNTPVVFRDTDKCLQMYDLTFDLSISSYLPPLLSGACVYTVSEDGVKYVNVLKTINEYQLTIIQIVPSIIRLGIPLLKRLSFPSVKYCLLGGEATTFDLLEKLEVLISNAKIYNYYGPTEATIYCSYHLFNSNNPKLYNGMLAIGKPFFGIDYKIVHPETLEFVKPFEKGELLISGNQITMGYLNMPEKNKLSFVQITEQDTKRQYYRSGDMCYYDDDGDVFYCGRFDNQIKIQGFRVELSEIEFKVRNDFKINNVAVPIINKVNAIEIILVLETKNSEKNEAILENLKDNLPTYMIPRYILTMEQLPINTSGKTDRAKVKHFVYESFGK